MKKIIINIDEEVVKELVNNMVIKKACGNIYGLEDEFVFKILKSIKEDVKEITLTKLPIKKGKK